MNSCNLTRNNLSQRIKSYLLRIQYKWQSRHAKQERIRLITVSETTPVFTISGKHCYGRVTKSTGANQIEIVFVFNGKPQKFKCQLYKVSCKETVTFQSFFKTYRLVYIYCYDFTECGKLLVDIYQTENDFMIGGTSANDLIRVDSGDDPDFYV